MIDLTPIFEAIIALVAALVTYKLIPWLKARTTESQQAILMATVRTLVYAAEQLYGAGKGKEKFTYVRQKLQEKGFDVDVDAIEAAVKEITIEIAKEKAEREASEARIKNEHTIENTDFEDVSDDMDPMDDSDETTEN